MSDCRQVDVGHEIWAPVRIRRIHVDDAEDGPDEPLKLANPDRGVSEDRVSLVVQAQDIAQFQAATLPKISCSIIVCFNVKQIHDDRTKVILNSSGISLVRDVL